MNTAFPLVSIGMPVFNGAPFVRDALSDLLAQDFSDFELIVSDNGSTDETPAILDEFVKRDRRVRRIRHAQNIGAYPNHENILRQAKARYFMYAAHDDRWHSSYVGKMYRQLEENPHVVMAFSDSIGIDEYSQPTGIRYPSLHTPHQDVVARVRQVISKFAWLELYALMRTELVRALGSFKSFTGGDVCFTLEMLLLGEIRTIPEPLFLYRVPTTKATGFAYYAAFNQSTRQHAKTYSALVGHLYDAVVRANLPTRTLAEIRAAFIDIVGFQNTEWLHAILAENGIAVGTSPNAGRELVVRLLDAAR